MLKKLLSISFMVFIFLSGIKSQTVVLHYSPIDTSAEVGSVVNISVEATGMTAVAAVQFEFQFDSTVLDFQGPNFLNINPTFNTPFGIGTDTTPSNRLVFQWVDVSDHSFSGKLFDIPFKILAANTSDLKFTETIISNAAGNQYTVEVDSATITGTIPQGNSPLQLSAGTASVDMNSDTCIDVKVVADFTDITRLDFSLDWLTSVASFQSVTNLNATLGLTTANNFDLSQTGTGQLGFTFTDAVGKTLSVGDVLFSACYTGVGTVGSSTAISFSDTPNPIVVENTSGAIGHTFSDGALSINNPPPTGGTFRFSLPDTIGNNGEQVCVPVTVENFLDLTGLGFSMTWDTTVLKFASATRIDDPNHPGNPLGSFYDLASTDTGTLGYLFIDFSNPPDPRTLPDYSALVDVCFDVVGNPGDVSPLNFYDHNPGMSVVDSDGNQIAYDTINGLFTVPTVMLDTFQMFGEHSDCTQGVAVGDTISIDVLVDNLTDLTSFQMEIPFDTTRLEYLSTTTYIDYELFPPVAQGTNMNSDKLLVLWLSPGGNPYSWTPDSTAIFTLHFRAKSGTNGDDLTLMFDNVAGVSGPNGDVPYLMHDIALQIVDPLVLNSTVNNLSCDVPNDGSISLNPTGGSGNYTYQWTGPAGPYSGNNLTGLTAGTYTVTVTSCNLTKVETYELTPLTGFTLSVDHLKNEAFPPGNNGEITVASSGSGTYSYNWTGPGNSTYTGAALLGLTQGAYSVTASDGMGCTSTLDIDLNRLTATGTFVNPSCNGGNNGSISLNVSGGTGTYSYQWNMGPGGSNPTNLPAGAYMVSVTDQTNAQVVLSFDLVEPSPINIQFDGTVSTPSGMSNGAVNITVTGGTPNGSAPFYGFVWSPGGATTEDLTGVSAGSYSVAVTDANGCTATGGPYNVSSFGTPNPTVVVDSVNCNGEASGTITVSSVASGTPNYTITGIGSAQVTDGTTPVVYSSLSAGSYNLTITDANLADTSFTVQVFEPQPLAISNINITPSSGLNGIISYDVTGGTPSYSYDWDHDNYDGVEDIFGLAAGSYTVSITDAHNCMVTQSFMVSSAGVPVPTVSVADAHCNGESSGTITISSVTGTNPDYTISGIGSPKTTDGTVPVVFSGLSAGSYTLTLEDNIGTDTIFTVTVGEPSAISFSTPVVANEVTPPGSNGSIDIDVSGGSGAGYSYQWNPGNYQTEDISGLTAGTYQLTVVDGNGCVAVSSPIVVGQEMASFSCSTQVIDTDCPNSEHGSVALTVFGGVPSQTFEWKKDGVSGIFSTSHNLMNVGAGVYHVTVTDGNGSTTTCDATVGQQSYLVGSVDILSSYNGYNVSGFGKTDGKAVALPMNGAVPYQFSWSTGEVIDTAFALKGGVNTVTITDNIGCTIELTTALTQPDEMTCSTSPTNTPCPGSSEGAVDLTVSGGVNAIAYDYSWTGPNSYVSNNQNISNLAAGVYLVTITDANGNTTSCNATVGTTSNMILNVSILSNYNGYHVSSPTAKDGSAQAVVSGGMEPYQFIWSNGDTNQTADTLGGGLNSVTVTDALGCSIEASATLTAPGVFSCSVVTENTVCPGSTDGKATVILSGGVMPVASYFWIGPGAGSPYMDSMLVDLSPGTYDVTVTDANGAQTSCSGTVEQLSHLTATVQVISSETAPNAIDGVAEVLASGGSTPYSYSWSNGETTAKASSLAGGVVTVTATDALGCESVISFVMPTIGVVTGHIDSLGTTCYGVCNGEATINITSGEAPFTYVWSNGQTGSSVDGLCAGEVSVTVTDAAGKIGIFSSEITEPDSLHIEFAVTQPTSYNVCDGSAVATVTGGTPGYSYIWNDGNPATTGPELSDKCVGEYLLIVSDDNNCTTMKRVVFEAEPTDDCFEASKILTPGVLDGSNDLFTISCLNAASRNQLSVFSRWGRNVYNKTNYDGTWTGIDNQGNDLPEGAYFWVLKYTQNGKEFTKKGHLTIIR